MKKIYSLFAALALTMSVFAATETTVYYAIPADVVGTGSVKVNAHFGSNDSDPWTEPAVTMTLTANVYHGKPIYTATFTDEWDGVAELQFQLFDGEDHWVSQEVAISSWTAVTNYNGKMKEYNVAGWVEYAVDPAFSVCGMPALTGVGTDQTWDVADDTNDMILDNGVYKWSNNMVYWDGDNYSLRFKVVKDHAWDGAFPSTDFIINNTHMTSGAGYYKIDIEYTPSPEAINVTATFVRDRVRIAFAKNGWAATDLLYNPSGYWYDNINLQPDSQEFKMIINEDWLGYKFGNDSTLTRISNENKGISSDNNSVVLADVEGLYTFFYQNGKLSVDFPTSFTRTSDANLYYQTLCVPFDATISNADVYDVTAANTGYVTLGAHEGNMVAGHSYIIKPTATSMTISKVNEGISVAEPINPAVEASALYGTLGDTLFYDHATDKNPGWTIYILMNNQFYLISGDAKATIASTKAHLHVNLDAQTPAPDAIRIIENATDIQNIEANEVAVKFIENGKLFIKKNGVVYDAVGTVVR